MRILQIIPSVGPLRGGPSAVVRTIAEGLASRGLTVDVATTDDNGKGRLRVPLGEPVMENGATYWYFGRQIGFYTVSWPLFRWLGAHVADYDVIHIHALFSFGATAGAYWAYRRKVPYVIRPLGVLNTWGIQNRRPFLKRLSLRLIESRVLANAAVVQFTSAQERSEAEASAPRIRSIIIPNPVVALRAEGRPSADLFLARYPELAGRRVILYLSRVDPKKGLDLLLEGFAKARMEVPGAVLIVAGNGEQSFETWLGERAQQLGVQRDVTWAGFLEGEMKRAAFAAAEVFVLPSYSENFGIAVVEAMASGLPVVVSDQVGICHEVDREGAGLVVRCDADEVSQAIIRILSNCESRSEMGRKATLLAKKFSPELISEQLIELYGNLSMRSLNALKRSPLGV